MNAKQKVNKGIATLFAENNLYRETNIEILRIFSMLLIIMFHYVYKSNYIFETFTINAFITKIFYFFGELGVNLLILITGYFMCMKKSFSIKKIILIMAETEFYYLLSTFISVKLGLVNISGIKSKILLFFPIILEQYWFITCYILVYILSPYLNILIENMNKKTYQRFLFILLLLWCVIPTFFGVMYNGTEQFLYYSRFIWFIIIYFVGGYLRLYLPKKLNSFKYIFLLILISFSLMVSSVLIIEKFYNFFNHIGINELAYFWQPNNVLMFTLSVSVFSLFLKIKVKKNLLINRIASTTLGIYEIHDGPLAYYIWYAIFKTNQYMDSRFLIFRIITISLIIFISSAIIDLIRQIIEKLTIKKILNATNLQ